MSVTMINRQSAPRNVIFVAAVLLPGCQPPSRPPTSTVATRLLPETTTEQKLYASQKYRICLEQRAKAMDDGTSDAMTIAQSMRGACKPEMIEKAEAMAGGGSVEIYWQIAESLDRREVDSSLDAVLAERKQQRGR